MIPIPRQQKNVDFWTGVETVHIFIPKTHSARAQKMLRTAKGTCFTRVGGGCASFPRMWAGTLSPGISIY